MTQYQTTSTSHDLSIPQPLQIGGNIVLADGAINLISVRRKQVDANIGSTMDFITQNYDDQSFGFYKNGKLSREQIWFMQESKQKLSPVTMHQRCSNGRSVCIRRFSDIKRRLMVLVGPSTSKLISESQVNFSKVRTKLPRERRGTSLKYAQKDLKDISIRLNACPNYSWNVSCPITEYVNWVG